MKKLLKRIFFLISAFFAIIAVLFIVDVILFTFIVPILNDLKADRLAKEWSKTVVLPKNTELIEIISYCENTGNGNHIEICLEMLIKSERTRDELKDYFGKDMYVDGEKNYQADKEPTDWLGKKMRRFKSMDDVTNYDGYYIITRIENAVSSEFDIRGH